MVESAIGSDNLITVTGGGITDSEDVWKKVLDKLGVPYESQRTNSDSATSQTKFDAKGSVKAMGVSVGAGASTSETEGNVAQRSTKQTRDYFNLVTELLSGSNKVIFLDDFHYINPKIQALIAQQVKELIRSQVSVVYASVPYHSDDIIRANSDLQGRLFKIDLSYWSDTELLKIVDTGLAQLNFAIDGTAKGKLISEAAGSPQLMQSLCLHLCRVMEARTSHCSQEAPRDITPNSDQFRQTCVKVSQTTDFDNLISKLLAGAKTKGKPRNSYQLKDGSTGDVYSITLKALKKDPASMITRYNELYEKIKSICETPPQSTGIFQACTKISDISAEHVFGSVGSCEESDNDTEEEVKAPLIEFDAEDSVIAIRDPYLLYSIRWTDRF